VAKLGWIALIAVAFVLTGCPKYTYKPYLPEEYRGKPDEPDPTLPGILSGKRGEYVIYGR
jgi:hypothetical protein